MYLATMEELLENNENIMNALLVVRELQLPNSCISAGMIRNFIWDIKHGYSEPTPLNDVDVIYYDPSDIKEETEKAFERKLKKEWPTLSWSVKNEARMHEKNGDQPYTSVEDAMKHWPETATAVAARLEKDDSLSIIAPLGLEDLFELKLRCGPFVNDRTFRKRCAEKKWLDKWPGLQVVRPD